MAFRGRYVSIGRIALICSGKYDEKICTIIDILDNNRVLIDGPKSITGVPRHVINLKQLKLTDFKITIPKSPKLKFLIKQFEKEDILNKWNSSSWAKKISSRRNRTQMTDFDRFKVSMAKKKRSEILKVEVKRLMK